MANSKDVKAENILSVVEEIHRQAEISMPDIGRKLGLAPSTVHGIVTSLEKYGVLFETGTASSTGGRKAQRYTINPTHRYIVAVNIQAGQIEIGVLNLGLETLLCKQLPLLLKDLGPEVYLGVLAGEIQELIGGSGVPFERIAGVGVCVPGPTVLSTGLVQELAGIDAWRGFPLGKRLADATGLPVLVDKDTYTIAQYLDFSQRLDRSKATLYLHIREGIGAALIHEGEIFRGPNGLAGEIGHITVRRDGARCFCGNTGCLELYCSDAGVLAQYNAQSQRVCHSVGELVERAQTGDESAVRVFVQAVRYLIDTFSHLILSYDPDTILLNCRWLSGQQALFFTLLDGLNAKSVFTRRHTAEVRLLEPEDLALRSAASGVAGQYLFGQQSPLLALLEG